ncbi:hypothetical protein E6C76_00335 [Pseudothauera nasutitermitis]|uniref:VCBS repeat-containing protein n=1 Tax=Pseudothauera nasutitermitis TaxID=2565930 RepID=A0A4S4B2V0_9RHOO|nr:hypothetical protein [Pseudothauera nasutitermitis]THF66879.1 hypothetical protein E6C76_00335 [Pseudothauera nasutitermitis]
MKIAEADIRMRASHTSTTRFESSERLNMWVDGRGGTSREQTNTGNAASAATRVSLSAQALAAQNAATTERAAASETEAQDPLDARLRLLVTMIERLTGRQIRVFNAQELQGASGPNGAAPAQEAPRAGFGLEYDYQSTYAEFEQVGFAAEGTVRTADGREISFQLAFEMQRSYVETSQVSIRAGDQRRLQDPLVFDFGGPASALSDLRFDFDLDADGTLDSVPLLNGKGFLAFDRDGNGRIDNGRELFGPTSGDGFAELAALDSDRNGWIDEADLDFSKLYVWYPSADGSGSLVSLKDAGVGAIHLGRVSTPFDLRGAANDTLGVMRSTGIYLREDGGAGTISQIDLSV